MPGHQGLQGPQGSTSGEPAAGCTYTLSPRERPQTTEASKATNNLANKLQKRRKAKLGWEVIRVQLVSARVRQYRGVDSMVVNNVKYTVLDRIGQGGFAKVYTTYSAMDGLVALKVNVGSHKFFFPCLCL